MYLCIIKNVAVLNFLKVQVILNQYIRMALYTYLHIMPRSTNNISYAEKVFTKFHHFKLFEITSEIEEPYMNLKH